MIPRVEVGQKVRASDQNELIDQVNENTTDIADLKVAVGEPEAVQELIDESITAHVTTPEPHPAYDDIPSLLVLFENGLA